MKKRFASLFRQLHFWGAVVCVLPVLVMTVTGMLLLLKKDIEWIQPASVKLTDGRPEIAFEQILESVRELPEMSVDSWADVNRLDVRPAKGIVKVRSHNHWEAQLSLTNGEVQKLAFRRSDIIESIHDGSFFHQMARLGLFFPAAFLLLVLSLTGIYLFVQRLLVKRKKSLRLARIDSASSDIEPYAVSEPNGTYLS